MWNKERWGDESNNQFFWNAGASETSTIEEAALLAVFIERTARMQVLAQSIGKIKPIEPAIAREAHDYRLKPRAVAAVRGSAVKQGANDAVAFYIAIAEQVCEGVISLLFTKAQQCLADLVLPTCGQ